MQKIDFIDICRNVFNSPKDMHIHIDYKVGILVNNTIRDLDLISASAEDFIYFYEISIGFSISLLLEISKHFNLELQDCIDTAYNVISKRKGEMVNGTFVKK